LQEKTFWAVDNLCLSLCHPVVFQSARVPWQHNDSTAKTRTALSKPLKIRGFLSIGMMFACATTTSGNAWMNFFCAAAEEGAPW